MSTPRSPFEPQPPRFNQENNPLSANGRLNRISYLAWSSMLNLLILAGGLLITIFNGTIHWDVQQLDYFFYSSASVFLPSIFLLVMVLYGYFHLVFLIRRLHDLNQSGWLSLLMLVPMINGIFIFYVLLASGSPGFNSYGAERNSLGWEKLLAWLSILLGIGIIVAYALLMYGLFNMDAIMPHTHQLMHRTPYF